MNITLKKPDALGALASGLCLVHCIATPFLFLLPIGFESDVVPNWWKQLDVFFLIISFLAVLQATKTTAAPWIKPALWLSWSALTFLLLNEKFEGFPLPEIATYAVAISLVFLHLYNRKYCQCKTDTCCAKNG
ncbi:MerC domain-containing protein [Flavobacterium sp. ASW18X]|uniref:MerC domain-containing protein n=1 Tax=Flavobacterium sp. ASW18X TaxID=2572595 RepID=UPI0010ADF2C1|nr:MerC domain-containing protein [Flavobacterium sp. ASW18X]TKD61418.1 MerC domain-containing protein [Flavobacterium sp. ASW18X]